MPTKIVTKVTNASTKEYSYSGIDLLDPSLASASQQLDVYLTPASTGVQVLLTLTTDYTIDTTASSITLVNTVANDLAVNDIVTIDRDTKSDSLYTTFTGLNFLRSINVQNAFDQVLHVIQENDTGIQNALTKSADETSWEGQNLPSTGCSAAISGSGWTTLSQVQSLLAGTEVADIVDSYYHAITGDGVTTVFPLTSFPTTDVDPQRINIYIDGVQQNPNDGTTTNDYAYAMGDTYPEVTFTVAPPNGTTIVFRALKGSVLTSLAEESVDGSAIVTGTLSVTSLNQSSGADNRFISFDSGGNASVGALQHTQMIDFDSGVVANRLDEMSVPLSDVDMNGNKVVNVGTGSAGTSDACTVAQMESHVALHVPSATTAIVSCQPVSGAFTVTLPFKPITFAAMAFSSLSGGKTQIWMSSALSGAPSTIKNQDANSPGTVKLIGAGSRTMSFESLPSDFKHVVITATAAHTTS